MLISKLAFVALLGTAAAQAAAPDLQSMQQEMTQIAHTTDAKQRDALLQKHLQHMKSYSAQCQQMMASMPMKDGKMMPMKDGKMMPMAPAN
ncbi:hypothetical protein [Paludibacterium yongneupense]|uniref:hypothetical protein n=1 Tax=Paludibacterium yongneupense TaxID=400061 RepID=UPI00040AEF2F|nr:hypothetical protein [Paludibacterium yongneupense]